MRRTFVSWLANQTDTPLTEVQAAEGHSSVLTTQIYVRRDEAHLRIGMEGLGANMVTTRYSGGEWRRGNPTGIGGYAVRHSIIAILI